MAIYPKPPTYTLDAGRCIVKDGTPFFTLHGVGNYDPCELDTMAKAIVASLNRMEMAAKAWSPNWDDKTPMQKINNLILAAENDEVIENSL